MRNAFYDFSVSPYSYDFVIFVVAARALGYEHVVFVPGVRYKKNADGTKTVFQKCSPEEQVRRMDNLLLPLCDSYTICETREEAKALWSDDCFPPGYTVDHPKQAHTPVKALRAAGGFKPLTPQKSLVDEAIGEFGKLVVAITIRESSIKPARNSNIGAWIELADGLKRDGMTPVFVPDTENQETQFGGHLVSKRAAVDVRYRLALYSIAALNMGISNGPLALCFYSTMPLLFCKPLTAGHFETSAEFWAACQGIPVGTQPAWFNDRQRIVWRDDTLDVLVAETNKWFAKQFEPVAVAA